VLLPDVLGSCPGIVVPDASRKARAGRVLLVSLCGLLAALKQETTGIVPAVALSWLAIAWISGQVNPKMAGARQSPDPREFVLAAVLIFLTIPNNLSNAGI
jgi:hypothetical protein